MQVSFNLLVLYDQCVSEWRCTVSRSEGAITTTINVLMGTCQYTRSYSTYSILHILIHHTILLLQILEIISEKADLYTPAKKLCTLEGAMLQNIEDIKDGAKYVAVEGSR